MFESNKSIEDIRAQELAKVTKAQAVHDKVSRLLDVLPSGSPVPAMVNPFGYCAESSLAFQGPGLADRLLQLYPPLPAVDVRGDTQTQKPVQYLRNEEATSAQLPIHPVVFKHEKAGTRDEVVTAQWWTNTPVGVVQVMVRGVSMGEARPDASRFNPNCQHYSTGSTLYYDRKPAVPVVRRTSLQRWNDRWQEYKDRTGVSLVKFGSVSEAQWLAYREHAVVNGCKRGFVNAIKGLVESTGNTVTRAQALSPTPAFKDLGEFADYFTPDQADELFAFVAEQASTLAEARDAEVEAYREVEDVLAKLFSNCSGFDTFGMSMTDLIRVYLRQKTGLDVTLRSVRCDHGTIEVWSYFQQGEKGKTLVFPVCATGRRLQPQHLEVAYL